MTIESAKGIDTILLAPQATTDGDTLSARLDTNGAGWATIRVNLGLEQGTDADNVTLSLLESNDTIVTNFATLRADLSQDCETAHIVRYEVDLRNRKRYLRLVYTAGTSTGSDHNVSAMATLYRNRKAPATTEALTTEDSGGTDVYFP